MIDEAKVIARNKCNAKANYVSQYMHDFLSQYIGKKVVKNSPYRTWTAKIKNELNDFISAHNVPGSSLWFSFSNTAVTAEVKLFNQESGYSSKSFFICVVENDVLVKTCEPASFCTDYSFEEVSEIYQQIKTLESQVSDLKHSIYELR